MKKTTLAYVAGLMDGEGSVMLTNGGHRKEHKRPHVSLTSTTYAFLSLLKGLFGGSISKHRTYKRHHKRSWMWSLCSNAVFPFLTCVVPFMLEPKKVRRAKFILKRYKEVTVRNGKYSKSQLANKLAFEKDFYKL